MISETVITGDGQKAVREAVIFAPEDFAGKPALAALDGYLVKKGMAVGYDAVEGRPVLRVTGFRHERDLIAVLEKGRFVAGEAQTRPTGEKLQTRTEWVKENSLVLSAFFYTLGNIATMLSGWFRRDADELRTGAAFTVGDSTMLLFGKLNDREKYQEIMQDFGAILKENGHTLAPGSVFSPAATQEAPSNWAKARKFMHNKVIAVKSLSEITAGISFARAGLNQNNPLKTGAGTAIATGFAIGLLTPEKNSSQIQEELGTQTAEETERKIAGMSLFKRLLYKLQQNPLGVPGTFSGINNLLTLAGAIDEKRWIEKTGMSRKLDEVNARLHGGPYKIFGRKKPHEISVADSANARLDAARAALNGADGAARLDAKADYVKAKTDLESLERQREHLLKGRKIFGKELDGKHFWIFNVMQSLFFLAANTLYAKSSKSGGKSLRQDALKEQFLSAVAGEALQTGEGFAREEIINLAAKYAGGRHGFNLTVKEARRLIDARLQLLQTNPWLQSRQPQNEGVAGDVPGIVTSMPEAVPAITDDEPEKPRPPIGRHQIAHLPVEGVPVTRRIPNPATAENLEQKIARIAASRENAAQNFVSKLGASAETGNALQQPTGEYALAGI